MSIRSIAPKAAVAVVGGALIALAAPLAASAHVTVAAATVEPGSYTVLTVQVPNESDTAATNRVELDLPTDTPFASVRYVPMPGWDVELVRSDLPEPVETGGATPTEAVTSVVWTAQPGSELGQGAVQRFELSVGPVPDTGSITFPATQTYTDGTVVDWAETIDDAEYPAPVLYVTDEAPTDDHHAGAAHDETEATATATTTEPAGDDVLARVFGIAGLVLGAVAVTLAATARKRVRS